MPIEERHLEYIAQEVGAGRRSVEEMAERFNIPLKDLKKALPSGQPQNKQRKRLNQEPEEFLTSEKPKLPSRPGSTPPPTEPAPSKTPNFNPSVGKSGGFTESQLLHIEHVVEEAVALALQQHNDIMHVAIEMPEDSDGDSLDGKKPVAPKKKSTKKKASKE